MTGADVDMLIRQAMGGDVDAIAWIVAQAEASVAVVVIVMAALLQLDVTQLTRASEVASTSRERQVVVIARAHLAGDIELVDVLARDHLVEYPDSLIVSWIASCSTKPVQRSERET